MELKDICLRILEAKAVFNEIAPKAGAYMVVVINDQQYNPLVFRPGNGLLVHYIRLYPDLIGPQYQALIMEMVSTIIELEKEL